MSRVLAALMLTAALHGQSTSYERGTQLVTPELVADLEAQLAADPDNADARETLVAYYARAKDLERLRAHAWWLIENRPDRQQAGIASLTLAQADQNAKEKLAQRWEQHLLPQPADLAVLSNGIMVLQRISFERTERTLQTLRARPLRVRPLLEMHLGALYGLAVATAEGIGTVEWPEDAGSLGIRIKPALLTSSDRCIAGLTGTFLATMLTDPRFQLTDRATPEILAYARTLLDRGTACSPRKGMFRNMSKRLPKQPPSAAKLLEAKR